MKDKSPEFKFSKKKIYLIYECDLKSMWNTLNLEHMKLKCVLTEIFVLQPERRPDLSILQQYGSEGRGKEEGG